MPDLLTHVLIAYILATLLSFRYEWLTPQFVTVVMLGALVPDLTKIQLLVDSYIVKSILGIPFDWYAIHTAGGALVAITIGALLTDNTHRRRVFALLALGAASHLLLDAQLIKPSGYASPLLWPFTAYQPPTPGLYVSYDRWPALVAGTVAAIIWYWRWHWIDDS